MIKFIIMLLFPIAITAQVFVSTGLDVRNALVGSPVNAPAYDGTFSLGIRKQSFQIEARYETFKAIEYQSIGVVASYVFIPESFRLRNWRALTGIELAMIHRDVNWLHIEYHNKVAASGSLQYMLFEKVALGARTEAALRGDLDTVVVSGFLEAVFFF